MADEDKSNGYEANASEFSSRRSSTIGVPEVEAWATTLPKGAAVLDLGCGVGVPIGTALARAGCEIYGVDASAKMIAAFRKQLPDAHAICEAVEDSRSSTARSTASSRGASCFCCRSKRSGS